MILITGATGTIGRAVLARMARTNEPIRALSRDTARIPVTTGVQAVQGDFADAASLERAVAGVRAVFLLTPGGPASAPADRAVVAASQRSGVVKVVKLSSIGAGAAFTAGADWHAEGEDAVRASGLAWTLLRPSAYASNALRWAPAIRTGQPIPNLTGVAEQGIIDPRDIAEIAVRALTTDEHDGKTYTLTGPELLSTADQAKQLGEVLGRTITTVEVSLDVAHQQMLDSGMDTDIAEAAIRGLATIKAGHNGVLTDDIERILKRPPVSFRTWADDHRANFETGAP